MIGFGVASSLVHEVGHQGAALLGLVESLRAEIRRLARERRTPAWDLWERWISEIVADFWSIGRIGIGSTLGLVGLVSLPGGSSSGSPDEDPHPMPWVRVLLSCAIGDRLYPDPQWAGWPRRGGRCTRWPTPTRSSPRPWASLRATMPELVSVLVGHRSARLGAAVAGGDAPQPAPGTPALLRRFAGWAAEPALMTAEPPTMAFAVLGQARASGRLSPERESAPAPRPDHRLGGGQHARDRPLVDPHEHPNVRRPADDLVRSTPPTQRQPTAALTGGTEMTTPTTKTSRKDPGAASPSPRHRTASPSAASSW